MSDAAHARLGSGRKPDSVPDCASGKSTPLSGEGPGRFWMLEFQNGDNSAFDRIVVHYRVMVHRFIYRYLQDLERAEDLCQEVFLRVYRAGKRYQPTAGFRTWLFTIAYRLCLNELRSRRRERRIIGMVGGSRNPDGMEENFIESVADVREEKAHEALERQELEEAISQAIAELPPSQRTAILLLRFEDLSYKEIGNILGLSVMAVKSLINRGRENLRSSLRRFI